MKPSITKPTILGVLGAEAIWFFGKRRGADLIAKIVAIEKFNAKPIPNPNPSPKKVLDRLYKILDILDSKAAGLLTADSLFLAILGIIATSSDAQIVRLRGNASSAIDIQLWLAAISAFLCLLVAQVTWRFYLWVPSAPTNSTDFNDEIMRLANAIDDRTHYYWLAWSLATVAFVLTLVWWWHWWWVVIALAAIVIWCFGRG